jgi:AAA family ATPase
VQDEIDALASSRSNSAVDSGTHEGVLFSLLNEMDGVEALVGVTVIGATNRPEVLVSCPGSSIFRCWATPPFLILKIASGQDPALMRPGRLDRILYVGPPDYAGRVDILRIRTRNMAVEPALDLDALATLVRSPLLPFHRT